jgi:uncharacterized protein YcfJ
VIKSTRGREPDAEGSIGERFASASGNPNGGLCPTVCSGIIRAHDAAVAIILAADYSAEREGLAPSLPELTTFVGSERAETVACDIAVADVDRSNEERIKTMDKSMIKGILIGGAAMVTITASGITGYKAMTKPSFAEVIAAKEVTEAINTPRQECQDVQVQKQAPVKDSDRVAGTVVGGIAGGLLGSAVGAGRGKTVATVAGAAAGAYGGNQVQKTMQQRDVVKTTETRCKTVNETSKKLIGYDVTYRLDGKENVVRTLFNPGHRIPVKDGQLVLIPPEPKK